MEEDKLQRQKTISIGILVLIGVLVTIDLAFIYYQANFNRYAMPSFCSVSELIDCDGVARTTESQFLGIPLAYWGLFLYSFITMLLSVDFLKKIPFLKFLEVFKNKFHYIASLGLIAFVISMILLCVSLFGIHKICIMCAITYCLDLAIGLVAVRGIEGGFVGAIKQSWKDFVDALKSVPYRIAFIVVMVCAGTFLGWAFDSATFSPSLKTQRAIGEFLNAKTNKYAVKGNLLGTNAKDAVVIKVYSDYMCPMCNIFNMMIHKMTTEFDNIRIEHHSLPLDQECNKYLSQPFHIGSCNMARYAEAAYEQGKFWEVNSLFFEKKPETEDAIIELLSTSGFGLDMEKLKKDAHSQAVEDKIQKDIKFAVDKDQLGTPIMIVGEDFSMGIPRGGYPALKEMVRKNGGNPKHKFF